MNTSSAGTSRAGGWTLAVAALVLEALLGAPFAGAKGDAPTIRLKSRTFQPSSASAVSARQVASGDHVLLLFDPMPEPDELAERGIVAINFVPDSAVVARVTDASELDGLPGLVWVGELGAGDKWSPEAVRAVVGSSTSETILLVEALPDTEASELEGLVTHLGGRVVSSMGLPPHFRHASGSPELFDALAVEDVIAWLLPANEHLLAGGRAASKTRFCPGPLTPFGPLANFATVDTGWDGPGLGATDLSFRFVNGTPDIAGLTERLSIREALAHWSAVAAVNFRETTIPGLPHQIEILWAEGFHGDSRFDSPFDGPNGVRAHAFFPAPPFPDSDPLAGDVHFDEAEPWRRRPRGGSHLFTIALHEIGHSLGLDHSSVPGAVMQAFLPAPVLGLHPDDVAGIRSLYATRTALRCQGLFATISGTPAANVLTGTPRNDIIAGGPGSDRIAGRGGDDIICGGSGSDAIDGGSGNDSLFGNGGDDQILGAGGSDAIRGGRGFDGCDGGAGVNDIAECE